MADYGAGEILLTSMDRDGTRAGFNLPLTRAISDAVSVPVIARLEGTNVDKGRALLKESGLDIVAASDLTDAAQKAVAAAK